MTIHTPATLPFIRLFGRYLREQGLPVTQQRETVAQVVFSSTGHLSVDEIERVIATLSSDHVAGTVH
ncbi:MAG: hypothetical protein KY453_02660 [Gemmatimonadetes bacterium]|nr:hypothetical protein [Gemmatimonadota bacterium]